MRCNLNSGCRLKGGHMGGCRYDEPKTEAEKYAALVKAAEEHWRQCCCCCGDTVAISAALEALGVKLEHRTSKPVVEMVKELTAPFLHTHDGGEGEES